MCQLGFSHNKWYRIYLMVMSVRKTSLVPLFWTKSLLFLKTSGTKGVVDSLGVANSNLLISIFLGVRFYEPEC